MYKTYGHSYGIVMVISTLEEESIWLEEIWFFLHPEHRK